MTADPRGLAALAERLATLDPDTGQDDWQLIHVSQGDDYAKSRLEWAAAILGPSGRFSPDGGLTVLPPDTVCACLDETGERRVTRWDRCERCGAFMEADSGLDDAWAEVGHALRAALATPKEEQGG